MRRIIIASILLATTACSAGPGGRPDFGPGGRSGPGGPGGPPPGMPQGGEAQLLFISPMGEPIRTRKDEPEPQDIWFDRADTDRDGAISRAEMRSDAARFFAVLDRAGDGEIDPGDIAFYEQVLAPEIRVGSDAQMAGPPSGQGRGGPPPGGGMGAPGGGMGSPGGGMGGNGGPPGGGSGRGRGNGGQRENSNPRGAGAYGYLDIPQPITQADTSLNGGVSPAEFRAAADRRFALLDTNGDGKITHSELPDYAPRPGIARGPGGDGPPPGPPPEDARRETD